MKVTLDELFYTWFTTRNQDVKDEIILYYLDKGADEDTLISINYMLNCFKSYEDFKKYIDEN